MSATSQPKAELARLARVLSVRARPADAAARWRHVLEMLDAGRIQGDGSHLLPEARRELADLNANGQMHTAVYFDPGTRRYWLLDGQGHALQTFPRGDRRQAEVAQLQREKPQALALALRIGRSHPALDARSIRAAQIVADHRVEPGRSPAAGGQVWLVGSQSDSELQHHVLFRDGIVRCDCKDWSNGAPRIDGRPVCKHILAAQIHIKLIKLIEKGKTKP